MNPTVAFSAQRSARSLARLTDSTLWMNPPHLGPLEYTGSGGDGKGFGIWEVDHVSRGYDGDGRGGFDQLRWSFVMDKMGTGDGEGSGSGVNYGYG